MVELAKTPTADVIEPPVSATLADNAATDASIARYLASGERMHVIADVGWKICAALAVLIIVAWALGLLPGAVRLF
jgi:hypothetical protein